MHSVVWPRLDKGGPGLHNLAVGPPKLSIAHGFCVRAILYIKMAKGAVQQTLYKMFIVPVEIRIVILPHKNVCSLALIATVSFNVKRIKVLAQTVC